MKFRFILLLFLSQFTFGQEDAWVYFKDKPDSQTFFDNPLSELTQRSLDRRTMQGIVLDTKDAPIHSSYLNQIAASNGITVLAKSKWLNMVYIKGLQADIEALLTLNFVDHIQYANHSLNSGARVSQNANKIEKIDKWQTSNETLVDYNYGVSATQVQMLGCDVLHQNDFTGKGKIIAIMDAGFPGVDTADPFKRLRDNNLILGGYDFVNDSNNFYLANNHGTNVLSTMGGFVDGQLVGTAPDAKYYLYITEDVASETPLEETNWIEAAEEADRNGVDVINTSLGYFTYDISAYSYTYSHMNGQVSVMSKAVDIAFSRGMICVTSAGNSGTSAEPHIAVPADAKWNVTVGSVDASKVKSGFSSIGPTIDGRIKPDVMAMGTSAIVATPTGDINAGSGTSFSSPILAGAITSLWSAFPEKKNTEIVEMVKSSADRFSNPNNEYGYGIPNLSKLISLSEEVTSILVFPNPVKDELEIKIPDANLNSKLLVYNSLGIKQKTILLDKNSVKINVSNLASGLYFYSLESDKKVKGKIIKN